MIKLVSDSMFSIDDKVQSAISVADSRKCTQVHCDNILQANKTVMSAHLLT